MLTYAGALAAEVSGTRPAGRYKNTWYKYTRARLEGGPVVDGRQACLLEARSARQARKTAASSKASKA
jgi:hypothetical protein